MIGPDLLASGPDRVWNERAADDRLVHETHERRRYQIADRPERDEDPGGARLQQRAADTAQSFASLGATEAGAACREDHKFRRDIEIDNLIAVQDVIGT